MGGAVISLRNKSYLKRKEQGEQGDNEQALYEVIDDVVEYLVTEKADLIREIEREEISQSEINQPISDYIQRKNIVVKEAKELDEIIKAVKDFLWGYGVINEYIEKSNVSDIAIKKLGDYWIKIDGRRKNVDLPLTTEKSIENFCNAVALKNSGNLTQRNAILVTGDSETSKDFNLRINLGIKPVADNSYVLIRKIPKWTIKPSLETLCFEKNMFNEEMYEYIKEIFSLGLNVCVCGEGGSGKSTLINAGIEHIPDHESKLGIQEIPELSSGKGNWIWLNVIKASGESEVEYTLEKLATQGLTMDVDWYIIGESKGGESMGLFDASYTGHKIAFTVHAPNSEMALDKVVFNMKKSGTDYTDEKLKELLSTLDVIIFMDKYKVIELTEIEGYDKENKKMILNPVFEFNTVKDNGYDLFGDWIKKNASCEKIIKKKKSRGKVINE